MFSFKKDCQGDSIILFSMYGNNYQMYTKSYGNKIFMK